MTYYPPPTTPPPDWKWGEENWAKHRKRITREQLWNQYDQPWPQHLEVCPVCIKQAQCEEVLRKLDFEPSPISLSHRCSIFWVLWMDGEIECREMRRLMYLFSGVVDYGKASRLP